ncbi:hypothetical protein LCGC14_2561870, partial [marine sediment metagenome]
MWSDRNGPAPQLERLEDRILLSSAPTFSPDLASQEGLQERSALLITLDGDQEGISADTSDTNILASCESLPVDLSATNLANETNSEPAGDNTGDDDRNDLSDNSLRKIDMAAASFLLAEENAAIDDFLT